MSTFIQDSSIVSLNTFHFDFIIYFMSRAVLSGDANEVGHNGSEGI